MNNHHITCWDTLYVTAKFDFIDATVLSYANKNALVLTNV
jgi:uncharacterized protein YaiI (UPF0178 family)